MSKKGARHAELQQMLADRRRALDLELHSRICDGRAERVQGVRDELEHSDEDTQGDIELALIQMRAETLARIDEALARLEAGTYGACLECEREISEPRLVALPFAVRCQSCEERREVEQGRTRRLACRRGFSLFADDLVSR
jgi:RNA polymerase-binding transcription factor